MIKYGKYGQLTTFYLLSNPLTLTILHSLWKKNIQKKSFLLTRIDCTCILDKAVICNLHPDGQIDALPVSNSKVLGIFTARALLLFYALISSHLFKAQLPFFQLHEYIRNITF
jgi:hypothetical protein